MNQLLQIIVAEQRVLHQHKRELAVREARGSRQLRLLAAAKPKPVVMKLERELKLRELRQRKAQLVERQLVQSIASEEERTKPLRRLRNQTDNNQSHCVRISRRDNEIARQHRTLSRFFVARTRR